MALPPVFGMCSNVPIDLLFSKRAVVATEFTQRGQWGRDLVAAGFDVTVPTVWLLEGLLMYLSLPDTHDLMRIMGELSAPGSVVGGLAVPEDAWSRRGGIRCWARSVERVLGEVCHARELFCCLRSSFVRQICATDFLAEFL